MSEEYIRKSRFLSWALRHAPEKIGLELLPGAWANISELIQCAERHGVGLTSPIIHRIVTTDSKGRYELSACGTQIRAFYGHSLDVDLDRQSESPPILLYHGTATRYLKLIMAKGISSGRRQFVHLSSGKELALRVGSRHGKAVCLEVEAQKMHQEGYPFYRMTPEIWLVGSVPNQFIRILCYGNDSE